jgi:hypothetical protein
MKVETKFTLDEAKKILESTKYCYDHKILTTLGVFSWKWSRTITVKKPTKKEKREWWIAGKFSDPETAKIIYWCNPYSGKYNFHGRYRSINNKSICVMEPLEELMNFLESLKEDNRLIK